MRRLRKSPHNLWQTVKGERAAAGAIDTHTHMNTHTHTHTHTHVDTWTLARVDATGCNYRSLSASAPYRKLCDYVDAHTLF